MPRVRAFFLFAVSFHNCRLTPRPLPPLLPFPSPFPLVGHYFSAGMSIRYGDSLVVGSALSRQHLAPKLPVGERFFSAQVVNQASATADQLTTRIPFTGAWRILVFAGDVAQPAVMERLRRLNVYLDGPESVVSKYTPPDGKRWDVVDVITVRTCLFLLLRSDPSSR